MTEQPDDAHSRDLLRRRLYRPGATEADLDAFREAGGVDEPAAPPVVPTPDEPVTDAPPTRRPRRRTVLIGAGAVVAVGAGAIAVRALNAPPELGPLERAAVSWRSMTGAPTLRAETVEAAQPTRSLAAVPFVRSRSDVATRAVFFGAGAGQTDFDMQRYFVGTVLVTVTLVTARTARTSVRLGVLAGVTTRHRATAVAVSGTTPAGEARWASSAVGPFDRPQVLRVAVEPWTTYVLRVEFAGPPLPDF